jgi:hypothetical protein
MPQFDHIREFFPNGFHETDKEVSYQNLKYMAIGETDIHFGLWLDQNCLTSGLCPT